MRYATERDNGTRMREHLGTGGPFPDLELPDHTGSLRRPSARAWTPAGRSCRTLSGATRPSWAYARPPTPCSAPTCPPRSAVPRPLDPPGLERLLVLGPADQRGAPAGLPGGDPDDPPRLGGSRQMSWCRVAFLAEPPTGDELAGARWPAPRPPTLMAVQRGWWPPGGVAASRCGAPCGWTSG